MSAQLFVSLVTIAVMMNLLLGATAYLILLERKVASWVQDRIGPNRVGFTFGQDDLLKQLGLGWFARMRFFGLGQPLADGIKMMVKEDFVPPYAEKPLFILAPVMVVIPALIGWAIIPWGGMIDFPGIAVMGHTLVEPGIASVTALIADIGILYVLAVGSVAVYGMSLGSYASNNKYAFFGGLRATAQMLSYEIPLGVGVLIVLLMTGSTQPDIIVAYQSTGQWNIIFHPLLAVFFFTCNLAEANRAPFDLAEAEQELVGGFHTEYSSMKFAMFFLGEYIHVIGGCAFFTLLFLGGWSVSPLGIWPDLPQVGGIGLALAKFAIYLAKVFALVTLVMLIRWTLPRFRFDQLMRLAWTGMIPIVLVLLLITGAIVFGERMGAIAPAASPWLMLAGNLLVAGVAAVIAAHRPPGRAANRRIPLEGSRFSAPTAT